jgi:para-aminobenzoate synthetase
MKTLIVDNYDSFTFNLYQLIAEVNGELPVVIENDRLDCLTLQPHDFDNVVISPGPGHPGNPKDFGVCRELLTTLNIPLLGVCLGHQGIGHIFGSRVIHAPEPMHGRLSKIKHTGSGLFRNIPQDFSAVRYHSLIVTELPDQLEPIAWTDERLLMGLRHRSKPFWGVQFHPESICTEFGRELLQNFKDLTIAFHQQKKNGRSSLNGSKRHYSYASDKASRINGKETRTGDYVLKTRKLEFFPDPEQAFVHLFGEQEQAFWLDSSLVAEGLSRFSFMGGGLGPNGQLVTYKVETKELTIANSSGVTVLEQSIFEYLKQELSLRACSAPDLPFDFNCGFVGYFGYELRAECGSTFGPPSPLPDASFLFADRMIVFDHQEKTTWLLHFAKQDEANEADAWFNTLEQQLRSLPALTRLATSIAPNGSPKIDFRLRRSFPTYIRDVESCLNEIVNGESYEVCLTNALEAELAIDPLLLYRQLRSSNPAPYAAFLRFGELAVASSSPERFLRIDRERVVESKPIKGTLRRGNTPEEDRLLREQLRTSIKDRAENLMIVDLLRNDLGRVCEIGSVHVSKLMDVESYATVHQLVSTVRGVLRPELDAIDCIRAAFPGGSMTGAPKIRTMEIINELEQHARGVYSGAIGFLSLNGAADLNIVIRTAVMDDGKVSVGVGGAIVSLSDPENEFDEILLKGAALLRAFERTTNRAVHLDAYSVEQTSVIDQPQPPEQDQKVFCAVTYPSVNP